ncbi:cytochrome c oxidase accessory protein CcoG [Ottowia thiooxydans]|uniref:cytochrome c oxidase accessory protein CcoG n=1 Tax=Ottowia thiooxydans TaxID=219182 RepID=UPI0003F4F5CB|nr:cytochrome c oxidase accessory protein CcoG [Ottowia thiooxydans]
MPHPEHSSPDKKAKKIIPILPESVALLEPRKKIQPRSISDVFSAWRWIMVWVTQLVFYVLPWLEWGERQMVLFDLETRRFYLFGLVLYPQDFIYLTGLLIISALALFLFTALAGRLWCGFACPQTVYTEMFLWIEHKVEGERSARLRLDASRWTFEKLWKRTAKHGAWIAVSLWTGFTFVGFFVPIRQLGSELLMLQGSWQLFWVLFYGLATYGNAGFLREQVCKHMCPYARFQSAMLDNDTLVVTYDAKRGEPRGARSKNAASEGLGSCIDCTLCVQVCPVGIDIRNGLQYECIGCGLCIDACNSVMDKVAQPRGLIRLATTNSMAGQWNAARMLRRMIRPRVLIYAAVLVALSSAMIISLAVRTPFKVDVVRDRAALSRIVPGGKIENIYRLQIMNATESPQRYRISARGIEGVEVASEPEVSVGATESQWVSVRLQVPYGTVPSGAHPVYFEVESLSPEPEYVSEKSSFLVPR